MSPFHKAQSKCYSPSLRQLADMNDTADLTHLDTLVWGAEAELTESLFTRRIQREHDIMQPHDESFVVGQKIHTSLSV